MQGKIFGPGQGAAAVPYAVFRDRDVFEREQARIFRGAHWSFVALAAELPEAGDYKTTCVGDTPVVVTRDEAGEFHAFVNRCAHRGAMVCRAKRGNGKLFTCVYHQWAYDQTGALKGVPFRRGIRGKGGMPENFRMDEHGLRQLRIKDYCGVLFATFAAEDEVEPIEDYLGEDVSAMLKRIFGRDAPIEILGDERQYIHGNWKLYAENVRDAYHASLLHLFHATFGTYRSNQEGGSTLDKQHRHSLSFAKKGTEQDTAAVYDKTRSYQEGSFVLEDPSLLDGQPDFSDGVSLVIMAVFPNLVVQQIANCLAVRQIIPHGADEMELVWTYFGYADDSAQARRSRLKQMNLAGPGGLISMEDGEAVEIVHRAIVRDGADVSYLGMGGQTAGSTEHLVSEQPIIGFWEYYQSVMDAP